MNFIDDQSHILIRFAQPNITYLLGCPKKHESSQMKLHMKILDPFDINMMPDFFREF